MKCKMIHRICCSTYWSIKKWSFFSLFREFFYLCLFTPYELHTKILPNERTYEDTHTHTHKHIYIYIYIFFSYIYFNYLVRLPLIFFDLAEILTRGSPIRQTHCLKNSSKFWKLAEMEHTEIYGFCWFLGPIYCRVIPGQVMQA